jgi:hypothetical protein
MALPILEIGLSATPHSGAHGYPGQKQWIDACLRYRTVVIAVGRQVGKSSLVPFLFLEEGGRAKTLYTAAYMSQGHPQSETMYERILQDYDSGKIVMRSKNKGQDRWIETIPFNGNKGMRLYFWSGDPEAHPAAHGKSLHRGIIDEASLVPEEAYTGTMRPMFNATQGRSLILGSPYPAGMGFSWFERFFIRGCVGHELRDPNYLSFNAPSESNPYADMQIINDGRRDCGSRELEGCLYDGRFMRDLGSVFPNLKTIFCLKDFEHTGDTWIAEAPRLDRGYVAGLDFGSLHDSTVLGIYTNDAQPKQVLLLRVRGSYLEQMKEIVRCLDMYGKPLIFVEGREGGMVLSEMLRQKYGEACRVIRWSSGGRYDKANSVVRAVDFFQSNAVQMIDVPWQKDEFRLFSKRLRKKGNPASGVTYEAPPGMHDDAVASFCYAAFGLPLVPRNEFTLEDDKTPKPLTTDWWAMCRETQKSSRVQQGASGMTF